MPVLPAACSVQTHTGTGAGGMLLFNQKMTETYGVIQAYTGVIHLQAAGELHTNILNDYEAEEG